MSQPLKLLDQVRQTLRLKHYARSTEETYLDWIKRFILFHHKRHPKDMGIPEIETFLTHLAVHANVAASTQNQAFSALLFLYREVLRQELDGSINALRAKKSRRLPVVLTQTEARRLITVMSGQYQLMAQLLYGSGLRLIECLRLRVKDIDLNQRQIIVHSGKGDKDRVTILPASLIIPLQRHLLQGQAATPGRLGG